MSVGKLYFMEVSPPCRAVLLTAATLGLKVDKHEVNLMVGEHLQPEFLKMNAQLSVPTYKDNDGTIMGDSHVIMAYLCNKYVKTDSLYPKEPAKRAAVDQRLFFDCGNVYGLQIAIVTPMYMKTSTGPTAAQLAAAESMYEIMNNFLEGQKWAAGTECATIADFSLVMSIMCIRIVAPMDANKYKNIAPWIARCEALLHFKDVNDKGHEEYEAIIGMMTKNDFSFKNKFEKTKYN